MPARADITALFKRIANRRVGVIGDFALDLYASVNTQTGEYSLETGQPVFWGSRPRTSLGGAGNVVQNVVALGVAAVRVVGCVGNDLFGREMRHLFGQLGVNTEYLRTPATGWDTCVYAKPMCEEAEANRIDFGTHNTLTDSTFDELLTGLEQMLPQLDVLLVNQQFPNPLLNQERATRLNDLLSHFPAVQCVADMRQVGRQFPNATLKVNTTELARLLSLDPPARPDLDWCIRQGRTLGQQRNGPLVVTRGEAGILYLHGDDIQSVAGLPLPGELDTVGAGDTVVATFGVCRGAGASPAQALEIANLAAAVTVQKRHQTGTASLAEILNLTSYFSDEPANPAPVPTRTVHAPD